MVEWQEVSGIGNVPLSEGNGTLDVDTRTVLVNVRPMVVVPSVTVVKTTVGLALVASYVLEELLDCVAVPEVEFVDDEVASALLLGIPTLTEVVIVLPLLSTVVEFCQIPPVVKEFPPPVPVPDGRVPVPDLVILVRGLPVPVAWIVEFQSIQPVPVPVILQLTFRDQLPFVDVQQEEIVGLD